ncbi:DUF6088 family protein [Malikia spinosa]|uniref:S-adenosylhomocysteine hydrolase n=1 Tax=Malikia spinosa TaxID=86180 RepID=A0A7C9NAF3_9BURK|nr:DUF6088 family protein [Malikia spinosa]MYZ53682.1 S-adenosylhomocysteine hydrolase [Malikia spinosa]
MSVKERIREVIERQAGNVILRADMAGLGSRSQITAVLRELISDRVLVRIGLGVYVKTRISSVTAAVIPAGSLESLAVETLNRLGVDVEPGRAAAEYNSGKSTQLPGRFVVIIGRRRITRKIAVGGRELVYEQGNGTSLPGKP